MVPTLWLYRGFLWKDVWRIEVERSPISAKSSGQKENMRKFLT